MNPNDIVNNIVGQQKSKLRSKCCGEYYVKAFDGTWICPNCNMEK